jgi:protein O-GlcNAc transferase
MHDGDKVAMDKAPSPDIGGSDPGEWMSQGSHLDMAGQPEQALAAFEKAHALSPIDVNSASACATLLSVLDRPQAAYRTLLGVEAALMQDADGAANLAIAAEGCGDLEKAQTAYARALELNPDHLRSLNNVAILAAGSSQWEPAIHLARKCIDLQPGHPPYHANLAEYLSGARRYAEAVEATRLALAQFPEHAELKFRHLALLAFTGELEKADAALKDLDGNTRNLLSEFLLKLETAEGAALEGTIQRKAIDHVADDALQIHTRQAFRNIAIGDWRHHHGLTDILQKALAESPGAKEARDWGNAPFYGLALAMHEDALQQMQRQTLEAIKSRLKPCPPFKPDSRTRRLQSDSRIHIGLAVQSLADARQMRALEQQLALHDPARFAVHIYAFTGRPQPELHEVLRCHAASVNELGHMTDLEAVGRIRLDRLDIYVEQALNPAWTRQEIALMRVAPVQLREPGLYRHHVPGAWDYTLSDSFIHPHGETQADQGDFGPLVRLPETCWLGSFGADATPTLPSREKAGLPADAVVLCSCLLPPLLDAVTFASWMKILRSLPDAVLWMPFCSRAAASLVREAQAAGVGPQRLIFSAAAAWPEVLAHLSCADLFLDALHINAAPGLEDALRQGVPALTCPGTTMAARMGGSILQAAGLPECILGSPQAYVAQAVRLGRNSEALQRLRGKLQTARQTAPLFELAARVRDREAAWARMAEHSRAGSPPMAFDVSPTPSVGA